MGEASLHTQMTCGWCDQATPWDVADCIHSTPHLGQYWSTDYIDCGRAAPGIPRVRGGGRGETGELPRRECILLLAVAEMVGMVGAGAGGVVGSCSLERRMYGCIVVAAQSRKDNLHQTDQTGHMLDIQVNFSHNSLAEAAAVGVPLVLVFPCTLGPRLTTERREERMVPGASHSWADLGRRPRATSRGTPGGAG